MNLNPVHVIKTKGLSKTYPGTAALVDVNYKV